jgi:hypothetical protein
MYDTISIPILHPNPTPFLLHEEGEEGRGEGKREAGGRGKEEGEKESKGHHVCEDFFLVKKTRLLKKSIPQP